MITNFVGAPLVVAVLAATVFAFAWGHRRWERLVSLAAFVVAAMLVIAVPAWRDALAGTFATDSGMVILVVLAFLGLGTFAIHHLHRAQHHPVWTTLAGVVGGTCALLAWAMSPVLLNRGSTLGPKTSAALGAAMTDISTGRAASAQTTNTRLMVLVVAVLVVVVLFRLLHKSHRRRPVFHVSKRVEKKFRAQLGGSQRPAIESGNRGGGGGRPKGLFGGLRSLMAGKSR